MSRSARALRAYSFDRYKTKRKEGDERPAKARVTLGVADVAAARKAWSARAGGRRRRDPRARPRQRAAERALSRSNSRAAPRRLRKLGVGVEMLDVKAMRKLGMGALLGVGQGSRADSRARGHALERRQEGNARRSPSSARACASTPAASRSSRPPAWRT